VPNPFASAEKAEGYAKARPPLHERIVERIGIRAATALDVGCGAGLSTAPLVRIAGRVFGVDPVPEMVQWGGRMAPGARFLAARAESLPFPSGSFDLITAAGSLNYVDPASAFPELRRVLSADGVLCIYDFSQADFPYQRPSDGAIPLSPEILARMNTGLAHSDALELPVSMTHAQYVAYVATEVNVPEPSSRPEWNLVFRGYIACLTPALS
jgi:ubiquinone/menaquinone biosynthesis C-methylase UbiE